MKNGYILGPLLIIFGAFLSYYTGMLIVKCSEHTGRTRYEDIALKIYGPRVARITSILNLICLIGFEISYIVFVSKAVPEIFNINYDNQFLLKIICSLIYSFFILLPMSIPRNVSALRYFSLAGVLCSMYLSLAVAGVFLRNYDKDYIDFKSIEPFKVSFSGLISSFPFIIFGYMYQVNIPIIYIELENRNASKMSHVISSGSAIAVLFYTIVGVFGYATFSADN